MATKVCEYCKNQVQEDDLELHERNCAQNPNVQEKTRKLGEIETYKKTVVLKASGIVRMFWAHSTGAEEIDMNPILETWKHTDPDEDHNSILFLKQKGFAITTE